MEDNLKELPYIKEKNADDPINALKGLGVIAAYIIVSNILSTIIGNILVRLGLELSFASVLLNFINYLLMITIMIIIERKELKTEFLRFIKIPNTLFKIFIGLLALYFSSNLIGIITNIIENGANYKDFLFNGYATTYTTSDNQLTIVYYLHNTKTIFFMFFTAAILGPAVEELVFRRAIFQIIKKEEIAFIISSTLFALIHIVSSIGNYSFLSLLLMFLQYFVSGFVLTSIYIKGYKNVYINIAVHSLYNIIAMLMILFA